LIWPSSWCRICSLLYLPSSQGLSLRSDLAQVVRGEFSFLPFHVATDLRALLKHRICVNSSRNCHALSHSLVLIRHTGDPGQSPTPSLFFAIRNRQGSRSIHYFTLWRNFRRFHLFFPLPTWPLTRRFSERRPLPLLQSLQGEILHPNGKTVSTDLRLALAVFKLRPLSSLLH
jgi:hypothetical protein